ncbi:MAG: winged helix-turn-helix transcriptional regulator [Saprospiraceae bacterium]|nr:winged helix-turn-helix transcriptional regulator [Saprospiraceae bacterium]
MKFSMLLSLIMLPFTFLWQSGGNVNEAFESGTVEIALRKIGHDILLQAGDSTSRVLPIEQVNEYTYHIKFDKPFSFSPDSLVASIDQTFANYGVNQKYLVNVVSCSDDAVIYGFGMFGKISSPFANNDTLSNEMVPCKGRDQESQCYYVKIIFEQGTKANYLMLGVPFLLLFIPLLLWLYKRNDNQILDVIAEEEPLLRIGNYTFYPIKNELLIKDDLISLTFKESKLLEILAANPNVVVSRDDLQKLVWEDEGVIVGRSLDVFISKLRKKLDQDPRLAIVSEHGKGYVLRVDA